jgi:hypothetical protein
VHVALPGVSLAPIILVLSQVLPLGKIGRPGIKVCVQVIDLNQNPVRYAVVCVCVCVCVWPLWLFGGVGESPRGKKPVNGFIHACEPRFGPAFRPAE